MSASRSGPVRARGDGAGPLITPETAGWKYLSFRTETVRAGSPERVLLADQETAIVVLSGSGRVRAGDIDTTVSSSSVFDELGRVVYVPPGVEATIDTDDVVQVAIGSAPAEGRLPARVFEPSETRSEIRGGGQAYRQVVHTLAVPLPAERLILYEVYVPRGTWSGWPPHCHDGRDGSPYLEEVYYFRLDRPEGWCLHRNWRDDEGFDETVVCHDGDAALVPLGYHTSAACPGANMYFLNYLAGDLVGEDRGTPPCFAAEFTWIEADWTAGEWSLPVVPTTESDER